MTKTAAAARPTTILKVSARQILDSRGWPTVEAEVATKGGCGRASVPSGASRGAHEAVELRDGGRAWNGKGVSKAVAAVNRIIAPKLKGKDANDQEAIDRLLCRLDRTKTKSKLGANAILAVSIAVAKACALSYGHHDLWPRIMRLTRTKPRIPIPAFNIINGGAHAGNKLDVQEYLLIPHRAKNFSEALRIGTEVYQRLRERLIESRGKSEVNVGDEGGFAPQLECVEEPLDLICEVAQELGYFKKIGVGMDAAANEFYQDGRYTVEGRTVTPEQLHDRWVTIAKSYPLIYLEDPFHEEAFGDFAKLTRALPRVVVTGDDLTTTNPVRVGQAIRKKACNGLVVKPNQIGTLSEALDTAAKARKAKMKLMAAHRSGDTESSWIADVAVGLATEFAKFGAPCRGERTAKYNQLLRIEQHLGKNARFAGGSR